MDILSKLFSGEITEEIAQGIFEKAIESDEVEDVERFLNLSRAEWNVYVHGAPPSVIAQWRYKGWPVHCEYCGKSLLIEISGWFAVENGQSYGIVHVNCLHAWSVLQEAKSNAN